MVLTESGVAVLSVVFEHDGAILEFAIVVLAIFALGPADDAHDLIKLSIVESRMSGLPKLRVRHGSVRLQYYHRPKQHAGRADDVDSQLVLKLAV